MAKTLRLAAQHRHTDARTMQGHLSDFGMYSLDTGGVAAVAAAVSDTHGIVLAACVLASARLRLAQATLPWGQSADRSRHRDGEPGSTWAALEQDALAQTQK